MLSTATSNVTGVLSGTSIFLPACRRGTPVPASSHTVYVAC